MRNRLWVNWLWPYIVSLRLSPATHRSASASVERRENRGREGGAGIPSACRIPSCNHHDSWFPRPRGWGKRGAAGKRGGGERGGRRARGRRRDAPGDVCVWRGVAAKCSIPCGTRWRRNSASRICILHMHIHLENLLENTRTTHATRHYTTTTREKSQEKPPQTAPLSPT
jgi:hypothetical protein